MPVISIITPVYQSAALLPECVGSVLAQTFPDWELLLVDDGSSDASPELCDRYAASDTRIRTFHQGTNQGVSAARNRGLQEARGDFIAFLDADDRYIPATLETLWKLHKDTGAESVACAHWNVAPDGAERVETLLPSGVYDGAAVREKLLLPLFGERLRAPLMNGYIWRYLFQASQIRKSGARFEGPYLEDELFLLEYFAGNPQGRLAVTDAPLYKYLQNPASATRRYMKNLPGVMDRYMELKEELDTRYQFGAACPDWRDNSNWANLLILIGNEYASGIEKTLKERERTVRELCGRPEMARAIRNYKPSGLGRNKSAVAFLIRHGLFAPLTLLYKLKNHM